MTLALPSETTPLSFLAPSEGSPPLQSFSSPSILIVNVDQTASQATLKDIFEARGLHFSAENTAGFHPYACFSRTTASTNALVALPQHLKTAKKALQYELKTLHGLQLVITIGISTHITLMDACGIALNRQAFRADCITRLPDGLFVAHLPAPTVHLNHERLTNMTEALDALLPDIEQTLSLNA